MNPTIRTTIRLLIFTSCLLSPSPALSAELLIPDWRNDVIHRVGQDGAYLGDFASKAREAPTARTGAWDSPRGALYIGGDEPKVWIAAERTLSEWSPDGSYIRMVYADSTYLEDPTGIALHDGEVFVLSEDKRSMMVFGLDGEVLRTVGVPEMSRSRDIKPGEGGVLWVSFNMKGWETEGMLTTWDPKETDPHSKPTKYYIPPQKGADGTISVHSFVFEDAERVLITDFSRGRLERWDIAKNERVSVLLDSEEWGTYTELAMGPDGRIYLAGTAGLYRFKPGATAEELARLEPFFKASSIAERYSEPFSPSQIVFLP